MLICLSVWTSINGISRFPLHQTWPNMRGGKWSFYVQRKTNVYSNTLYIFLRVQVIRSFVKSLILKDIKFCWFQISGISFLNTSSPLFHLPSLFFFHLHSTWICLQLWKGFLFCSWWPLLLLLLFKNIHAHCFKQRC